jgi:hypothetical protein
MAKYRIVQGSHVDENGTYSARDKKKNIITTNIDLESRFGREKFVRIEDREVIVDEDEDEDDADGLNSMTLAGLRKFAEEEEIDLGDANSKKKIIAAIRNAVASA